MARRPRQSAARADPQIEGQRLDKWLWFARVAKTRTLAAGLVSDGRVRVNRERTTKPAQVLRIGDVITVSLGRGVRVLRIEALGVRRGPPAEAQTLFEEIVPLPTGGRRIATPGGAAEAPGADADEAAPGAASEPVPGSNGRPNKRDRRALSRLKPRYDDP